MCSQKLAKNAKISIENIGGIERASLSLSSGINLLTGRNATNRTSLLQAVMAGLGSNSNQISLKAGADEGHVELQIGNKTYTRTLTRGSKPGEITLSGSPFIDDTTESDLFAFLLSENKARQEIRTGDPDLHEIVMDPIDTAAIEREITDLQQTVNSIEDEIEELHKKEQNIDALQEQRLSLIEDIEDLAADIETKQLELEEREVDLKESRDQQEEFEAAIQKLRATQDELTEVENELEDEREALDSLEYEHQELSEELSSLELPDESEDTLKRERRSLNKEKDKIQNKIDKFNQVISFNRDLLDEQLSGISDALRSEDDSSDPENLTHQLVSDEQSVCWTCGQQVDRSRIQETVQVIKSYKQTKVDERNEIESTIDDISSKIERIQSKQAEHQQLDDQKKTAKRQIDDTERAIQTLEERRQSLTDEIEMLKERVEELETSETHDELLNLNNELNELEREKQSLERDLKNVESRLSNAQSAQDKRKELETELDETKEQLSAARTRIETVERNAIENFNQHMDEVLDRLDYENIERIWLERRQTEAKKGRRKVEQTIFELNIVRKSDDGTVFEDTISHLSESEREVVGLIFALTGYITHEVYEEMPFLLLDSLEAIDAERIADLITYFNEYSDFVIAALLPEDTDPATELEATQEIITDI